MAALLLLPTFEKGKTCPQVLACLPRLATSASSFAASCLPHEKQGSLFVFRPHLRYQAPLVDLTQFMDPLQSYGVTRAVRPGEWQRALADLAAEGTRLSPANTGTGAGTADSSGFPVSAAKLSEATAYRDTSAAGGGMAGEQNIGQGPGHGSAGSVPPETFRKARSHSLISVSRAESVSPVICIKSALGL